MSAPAREDRSVPPWGSDNLCLPVVSSRYPPTGAIFVVGVTGSVSAEHNLPSRRAPSLVSSASPPGTIAPAYGKPLAQHSPLEFIMMSKEARS